MARAVVPETGRVNDIICGDIVEGDEIGPTH